MAYDDYLNKDAFRGGVMDAPDLQVRTAQAKIAAGAAHLLTSKEWTRLANRQMLEQQSAAIGMTGPQQASRARAAMNTAVPRFTAQELLAANQPGTVSIPEELRIRNIPGRGEMTVVNGVEIRGGPPTKDMSALPVPEEGYGYVQGKNDYLSTTPYGMIRGATPQLGDVAAVEEPVQQSAPVTAPTPAPIAAQALPPAYPEAGGFPFGMSTFQREVNRPSQLPLTGYATANSLLAQGPAPIINIPREEVPMINIPRDEVPMINIPRDEVPMINIPREPVPIINIPKEQPAPMINIPKESPVNFNTAPLTTDILGISSYGKPRLSPTVVANQLLGTPMPTQQTGENTMGSGRFNMMPQGVTAPSYPALNSLLPQGGFGQVGNGFQGMMGGGRFNMLPPQQSTTPYSASTPQPFGQYTEDYGSMPQGQAVAPEPMVRAVIPEGVTGQTELAPQYAEQPQMPMMQAAPQFATYRPPELKIQPFNVGQIMKQPSVSETLGMAPALRAYQAQTEAQINAYKANVSARRNAYKDSIDAQLKGIDLQKKQADVLSAQLANNFTTGGPAAGIANVGGKAVGYIQTGPKSVRIIDLETKKSGEEAKYEFRLKANNEIASLIQAGDKQTAAIMYQSLGGLPENFNLFAQQFAPKVPVPEGGNKGGTAKPTTQRGGQVGKYKVTPID